MRGWLSFKTSSSSLKFGIPTSSRNGHDDRVHLLARLQGLCRIAGIVLDNKPQTPGPPAGAVDSWQRKKAGTVMHRASFVFHMLSTSAVVLRYCARFLPFIFVFVAPQDSAGTGAPLKPEQRIRLEKALADSTLSRWQRTAANSLLGRNVSSLSGLSSDRRAPLSASVDGEWSPILLQGTSAHVAIHDPLRDRMVVFGGASSFGFSNDVWGLSLSGSPPWIKITPVGSPPSPRAGHTAIFDPIRDRMLIFGGYGEDALNDVWALSLSGTPAWSQLAPSGTPPEGGWGYSAIYDALRDRMIVNGSVFGLSGGVWALSLSEVPEWTNLVVSGTAPSPRSGHTAIYDPVRDRMVVFGGDDGSYPHRNDTWALSFSGTPTWTVLDTTAAIPGRALHTAIYDVSRDCMVIFGGTHEGGRSRLNDTWAMSLSGSPAWTQLTPTRTPQARLAHTAIYDPLRGRMVVFGGDDDVYYPDLNDVWALSFLGSPEWMPGPGTAPSPRNDHTAIYDWARDRMVIFAGYGADNDVWALSLSTDPTWSELLPIGTPPSARSRHTAIYDPVRSRMVVFGGYDGSGLRNDVWALSLSETPVWTALSPVGTPPMGREEHTAIYDPVRDRMVVYGGYDWPTSFNDVWELSLSGTPTWTQLSPSGMSSPPARYGGHAAIYDSERDRMVIFGGTDANYPYPERNDVWALSLSETPEWTELTTAGTPAAARERHTAIYDPIRDRMVVFQGHSHAVGFDGDPWALSLSGIQAWTHLTPTGAPGGRDAHTAIYDPIRDRMVIFAGTVDMHSDWEDVWALNWGAMTGVQPNHHFADALRPCYPNPFNPAVTIPFELGQDGSVMLSIYDVSGRLVKRLLNEWKRQGLHSVTWSGEDDSGQQAASGVYFCRLRSAKSVQTQKLVVLK